MQQHMLEQPAALRRARETVRQRALAPYTAPISPEPDPKFGDEDATSFDYNVQCAHFY